MPSLYRKPSGIWYADYLQNGRRMRVSLKTRSRAVAQSRLERVAWDSRFEDCPRLLSDLIFDYQRYCERTRKHNTVRANHYRWVIIASWFASAKIETIGQLTRHSLTQLRDHCWSRGLSNATINRYTSLIKSFLRWAYEDGLIQRMPDLTLRKLPEKRGTHRRVLTPEELRSLIDNAPTPIYAAFLELLSLTGCRSDEIRTLRCSQVDLDRAEIKLEDTKTHQALTIPLSPRALEICRSLLVPHQNGGNDFLLGGPRPFLNQTSVIREMRKLTTRLGIKATLHDLRSTFVSRLLDRGVSLKIVQELIGDKTARMVMEIYAQTVTGSHREAIAKL